MSTLPNPLTELLAEVVRKGITLRVEQNRLKYYPKFSMPSNLLATLKTHRDELLEFLEAENKPDKRNGPRQRIAELIRQYRRMGDRQHAVWLFDAWKERLAICEVDGMLPTEEAEKIAEHEINVLAQRIRSEYNVPDGTDTRPNSAGDSDQLDKPLPHVETNRNPRKPALSADDGGKRFEY